ncbi:class I SAM-dependent methyltransferase [Actinoplanes sp. NPDC026619]|uniref:class I SAM-dependent methyltransferase n=1 Tax=Actinoplanes sp. NPDC026619 TaxID=3155798 RepID=UPI0033DB3F8D
MSDEQAWDARYAEAEHRIWSGNPNVELVTEVADLRPGRALDLGCGEGADAVWLAGRGWQVTAVDISGVALRRAAEHAADAGVTVEFQRHNLEQTFPDGEFDLVSAQFLHFWAEFDREKILRRAAGSVAPGGVLLIEGHMDHGPFAHGDNEGKEIHFPTPDEVIAALDLGDGWEVLTKAIHPRQQKGPDGDLITRTDSTVKLRRNGF